MSIFTAKCKKNSACVFATIAQQAWKIAQTCLRSLQVFPTITSSSLLCTLWTDVWGRGGGSDQGCDWSSPIHPSPLKDPQYLALLISTMPPKRSLTRKKNSTLPHSTPQPPSPLKDPQFHKRNPQYLDTPSNTLNTLPQNTPNAPEYLQCSCHIICWRQVF